MGDLFIFGFLTFSRSKKREGAYLEGGDSWGGEAFFKQRGRGEKNLLVGDLGGLKWDNFNGLFFNYSKFKSK